MRSRIHYDYVAPMTDTDHATPPGAESQQTQTLFVKITGDLEAELLAAAKRTGVSKSGIVRMALPLGIARLQENLTGEAKP